MKNVVIYEDKEVYSAFPDIEKLQNGDLVVLFREAPQRKPYSTHIDSESRNILVRSKDNGKTWEEKAIVFEHKNDEISFQDPSLTQLSHGILLANSIKMRVEKKEPFRYWCEGTFTSRSLDNGYSWQERVMIRTPGFKHVATSDSVLELSNGELLIPLYGYSGETQKTIAFVLKSVDNGRSWKNLRTVAFDPFGNFNFDEPALCCLPSGKILCMIREDKQGYLYQSESLDNGETWSQPKRTDIWGYPAHLLSLRDGRVLCTYGYRRPPYGIRACLSYDEGRTWDLKDEIVLRSDGFHGDLGYPSSVELQDNQVLTVYYFHTEPIASSGYTDFHSQGIRFIAGTFYCVD